MTKSRIKPELISFNICPFVQRSVKKSVIPEFNDVYFEYLKSQDSHFLTLSS